jgi:Predicted ring-cleavage extradiol dioxygenase
MSFKLSPEAKIGWVYLSVSDLEKSIYFYSKIIGFKLIKKFSNIALLGTNEDKILIALKEQKGAKPKPSNTRGLYHFAILLPNRQHLAMMYKNLIEKWFLEGASDHLVSEALYLIDPDGHGIEIYSDRPMNEWKFINGELSMNTLPLDIESLLSELSHSKKEEFSNVYSIPNETLIGHIHLHVSDLYKAEKFYTEVLGLDITSRYYGAIFMSAGGYHHHIGANIWAGKDAPATPSECVNLISFSFKLPNELSLDSLINHLNEIKYSYENRLIFPIDSYKGIVLKDFDGNNIEIFI